MLLLLLVSLSVIVGPSFQLPSSAQWNSLNTTVQGRLLRGIPFARPCYELVSDVEGQADAQECSSIIQGYSSTTLRANNFGAYMNTQWETCQVNSSQCLLNSASPSDTGAFMPPRVCHQGSVPDYGIDVRSAEDAITGFNFSRAHGVRLVIKNTGHDFMGRSSAPGALALWMHNLQSITSEGEFVPAGCTAAKQTQKVPVVTYGAGVSFQALIDFAEANNFTIPTAGDASVAGGGGYVQGGGHSVLSNSLGLAVDRALQFEVVTPTGKHVNASECHYSDLFFALRGGGGGTFGAVLSVTTLALPKMSINAVQVDIKSNRDDQRRLIHFMAAHALQFAQAGWGGFTLPLTGVIFANPVLNATRANETIEPLRKFTQELGGNFTFAVEPSYKSFFDNFGANVPVGTQLAVSSRLIPVENFKTPQVVETLANAIDETLDQVSLPILFASTPFLYGIKGRTSVTPKWRSSLWHVAFTEGWSFNTSVSDAVTMYKRLSTAANTLRNITAGSGAYLNEADIYEPDFEDSFWGDNYNELVAIKNKYDPYNLLHCWRCVGWSGPTDGQYQCYLPQ